MSETKFSFDTLALHAGHVPDSATLSRAVPIYQTSSYVFRSSEHAAQPRTCCSYPARCAGGSSSER